MQKLIQYLYPFIRPHKHKVIGSLILSLALAGIKFLEAFLVKPIFDKGLSPNSTLKEVLTLAGFLLLLGIINFPCRYFHFFWLRYVVDQSTCALRSSAFAKLQRLPLSYFTQNKQGTLISNLLTDTQVLSQGFKGAVDIVREPLTALLMLGLAFYRDWQLCLVILVVAPLFILIFQKSGKHIKHHQSQVQEDYAEMTHQTGEGITGQKVVKAFNLQGYLMGRFDRAQDRYFGSLMKTTVVEELAHPLVEFVGALGFCGVIVFAHYRISSGGMTPGDFVSFAVALALLMDPIRKYSQANVKLNQALAAGERIFRIFETPEEVDTGTHEITGFKDKIVVENVTFAYPGLDAPVVVLKNFSVTLHKGEKLALVGESGSGKSTLLALLLRLYPLQEGHIHIDGIPIEQIKLKSLRALFGYVGQDIFLFHDTVRENIVVGTDKLGTEIDQAIRISGARDFVQKMPMEMETIIGDRGAKLSGGPAQRLTIARAFLHGGDILLFDEATSALDNESEKLVQDALERISGNKTVIAVAHRLSTVQNFDSIVVMKNGLKIEQGRHQDLLQSRGEYSKLHELGMRS